MDQDSSRSLSCVKPQECATHICRHRMSNPSTTLPAPEALQGQNFGVEGNNTLSNFLEFPCNSGEHKQFALDTLCLQSSRLPRQRRPDMHKSLTLAPLSTCKAFGIARYSKYSQTKACQAHKTARHFRQGMSTAQTRSDIISATASGTEPAPASASAAEDLVQYVVLRKDLWHSLKWPLGSIIAQACHASTAALWLSRDSVETSAYCSPGTLDHMHKVSMTCFLPLIALSS